MEVGSPGTSPIFGGGPEKLNAGSNKPKSVEDAKISELFTKNARISDGPESEDHTYSDLGKSLDDLEESLGSPKEMSNQEIDKKLNELDNTRDFTQELYQPEGSEKTHEYIGNEIAELKKQLEHTEKQLDSEGISYQKFDDTQVKERGGPPADNKGWGAVVNKNEAGRAKHLEMLSMKKEILEEAMQNKHSALAEISMLKKTLQSFGEIEQDKGLGQKDRAELMKQKGELINNLSDSFKALDEANQQIKILQSPGSESKVENQAQTKADSLKVSSNKVEKFWHKYF